MTDEIKISKKAIIISIIATILIASIIAFIIIKPIPFVSAAPECQGTPQPCASYSESACTLCGCTWTAGVNIDINIGDTWKDIPNVFINIGDVWKTISNMYINIGDVWKTILPTGSCEGTPSFCSSHGDPDSCDRCANCLWMGEF